MFTRLFGKSSFFSYAITLALFAGVFFFQISALPVSPETEFQHTLQVSVFFTLLFLFLALDWIVRIQYWSEKGIYHLFLFCLFFFVIPFKAIPFWELLSLFFFWIGFIQILGLDKKNNFIKSVFNAGLWMSISGLFINSYLFLFPVLWGILLCYNRLSVKSFLISLLPAIAMLILGQLVELIIPTRWFNSLEALEFQFNFPSFSSLNESVLFFGLALFFILVWIHHYKSFSSKGGRYLSSIFSLLLVFFGSLVYVMFVYQKDGIRLLLPVLTLSALSGSFLESIKRKWIREIILFSLLGIALLYRGSEIWP